MNRTSIRIACLTGIALTAFALGGFANQKTDDASNFASQTIDVGIICSDVQKSLKFYKDVLGFTEVTGFQVGGDFAAEAGLANKLDLDVHVLVLGQGATATKLKLMEFKSAPGARVDNAFIHSSYGFRYLTIFVKNLYAAVDHAEQGRWQVGRENARFLCPKVSPLDLAWRSIAIPMEIPSNWSDLGRNRSLRN